MFTEALLPDADEPISITYKMVFDGVSKFHIGGKAFDTYELLTNENLEDSFGETYQIFDIQKSEFHYSIKFYELDDFTFEAKSCFQETGNYILPSKLPNRLDPCINWKRHYLHKIDVGTNLVFHLQIELVSWHRKFDKRKNLGHKGVYNAQLIFPNVANFSISPKRKDLNINQDADQKYYFIKGIHESSSDYQLELSLEKSFELTVESDSPVFEITEFVSITFPQDNHTVARKIDGTVSKFFKWLRKQF